MLSPSSFGRLNVGLRLGGLQRRWFAAGFKRIRLDDSNHQNMQRRVGASTARPPLTEALRYPAGERCPPLQTDNIYFKTCCKFYDRYTICSGWNTSSKRSAVKKPSATQASFRDMFSL